MRYYINGHKVSSNQAKQTAYDGYVNQGGDPEEFASVWGSHDCEFSGEEKRELINEWSSYVVEIMTEEQDQECED